MDLVHHMKKLNLGSDLESSNSSEARKLSIERCIESLSHACQCKDTNCLRPSCQKMRRVVTHTKVCKRKSNGGCPICKQLVALCCYHAKHCQEAKCLVPFCSNIKHKLKQQQLQQRLQQAQLLRKRIVSLLPVQQSGPQTLHVDFEKAKTNFEIERKKDPLNSVQMSNSSKIISVYRWTPGQGPNKGMKLHKQIFQDSAVLSGSTNQIDSPGTSTMHNRAYRQLMTTLKSPNTPEQQNQILQILKSNPSLMAAFIKQRQQHAGQNVKAPHIKIIIERTSNTSHSNCFKRQNLNTSHQKQKMFQLLRNNPSLIADYLLQKKADFSFSKYSETKNCTQESSSEV